MLFTVEVFKADARVKLKPATPEKPVMRGHRFIEKIEVDAADKEAAVIQVTKQFPLYKGYAFRAHQTMVERVNSMTGKKFMERYDTPYYLSASSESYWTA